MCILLIYIYILGLFQSILMYVKIDNASVDATKAALPHVSVPQQHAHCVNDTRLA